MPNISSTSGGVNLTADSANVGGDVTGWNKIVVCAGAGAIVIIDSAEPPDQPADHTENRGLEPIVSLSVPDQSPSPPEWLIPRPEIMAGLKLRLLSADDTTTHGQKIMAIYGMDGVGKSTIAKRLMNDPDIKAQFSE